MKVCPLVLIIWCGLYSCLWIRRWGPRRCIECCLL